MNSKERDRIEEIGRVIVDSAIRVHRTLGPGLLESAYQSCLTYELEKREFEVKREVRVPLRYGDLVIENGYRIDMLIDRSVVIENKVIERLLPVHRAQLLTYLEFSGTKLGYLLNWNVTLMKHGIRRFVLRL